MFRDQCLDVSEVQEMNELFMALPWQGFGKAVGWHLGCRNPANRDVASLDLLTKPVIMDVDMFQLCSEYRPLLLHDGDSLFIITEDGSVSSVFEVQSYVSEETLPP